jgi:hypothetical protein
MVKATIKRPVYTDAEHALAARLEQEIRSGSSRAYAKLTKLAARAVKNGRFEVV